jgi:tight adherence protein B
MLPLLLSLLLLLASTALAGALAMQRRTRRRIESRIALVAAGRPAFPAAHPPPPKRPWLTQGGVWLRAAYHAGMARDWGTSASAATLLAIGTAAAAIVWTAARAALPFTPLSGPALAAIVFFLAPHALLRREQSRAEERFVEAFPDVIDMVIRMLRAGLPVASTIRLIGREAAPPVDRVFSTLADQIEIGIPFEEALDAMARRIALPDFRFFAVVVSLQRATGGNLASTLEILGEVMRKRRALRLKAAAATAEVRVSAYVISTLPFILIGMLLLVSPSYLTPLLADRRGNMILTAAAISLLFGLFAIWKLMRTVTSVWRV